MYDTTTTRSRDIIREALRRLGTDTLLLAIHDVSFPSAPGEDTGRGSPNTRGAMGLLRLAHDLGFGGVQLGPQGQTARDNPSPYDGTMFSRNVLSLDLVALAEDPAWHGLLSRETLARLVARAPATPPDRADHAGAFDAVHEALDEVAARFRAGLERGERGVLTLAAELEAFRQRERDWLERDALYHAISDAHGGTAWYHWPEALREVYLQDNATARRMLVVEHARAMQRYALGQFLAHRQHEQARGRAHGLGLTFYGDLQVGMAPCDTWGRRALLMRGYRLGAPPSRTNREGQPWGYAVLDPAQYRAQGGGPGAALTFLAARVGKLLDEFDGLRIDHPHGLVCPWVYRADDPDPIHAVQHGARLFGSPDLSDHPQLARYAINRPEQLCADTKVPRHADEVLSEPLDPEQVDAYATLFDVVVQCARSRGQAPLEALVCEILSTCPRPLAAVRDRHGLGRFRVTQKANVHDPNDVYRTENAQPEDWVMVGTHDTPPLWHLVRQWQANDIARDHAAWLADRLSPPGEARERLATQLATDPAAMAHARIADLFVCRARHVMIFFADLFGLEAIYNEPGTSHPDNWTLRLPPDWQARYQRDLEQGRALDLPRALVMALRAIEEEPGEHADLIAQLEALSAAPA